MIVPKENQIHALALLTLRLASRVFSSRSKACDGPLRALACTLVVMNGRRPELKWDEDRPLTNKWMLRLAPRVFVPSSCDHQKC